MPDLKDTERLLLLLETDLAEGAAGNAAFFLLSLKLPEELLALGAGAGAADLRDRGALFPVSVLAETSESESESSSLSYKALGFFAGGCAGARAAAAGFRLPKLLLSSLLSSLSLSSRYPIAEDVQVPDRQPANRKEIALRR